MRNASRISSSETSTTSTPSPEQICTVNAARERCRERIRDRARCHGHRLPGREPVAQRRRALRLDRHHAHAGGHARDGDPRDEPAPAARDDDRVDAVRVLEDLEPDRPLAGDRARSVEGMHEHAPGLGDQLLEAGERGAGAVGLEVDRRPVGACRRHLRLARVAPHDEQRVDPLLRRAPGQCLRVVARGDRDDTTGPLRPGRARRGS